MNKAELIATLRDEVSISKIDAIEVVEIFFGCIIDALSQEERVEIRGLCSFFCQTLQKLCWQKSENWGESYNCPEKTSFFQMWKRAKRTSGFLIKDKAKN